jgi:class 3 adenylate cyclase
MAVLSSLSEPREMNLLVGFVDLSRFHPFTQRTQDAEVASMLSDYYELVGDAIEGSGGQVVKFMGDAALTVHAEEDVDRGVQALLELKQSGDAWLADRGIPSEQNMNAHFGSVTAIMVGTRTDKRPDIFGDVVATAVVMRSRGFALTAQVFRKLSPETRTLFKKHTPPISYIPLEQRHRD